MSKIYFQGTFGAYSHLAALEIEPKAEIIPCKTFDECFLKASSEDDSRIVIPESNRITGNIGIEYLIFKYRLNIHSEHFQNIEHNLFFNNVKNIAQEILADDKSAAIRLANDEFCQKLIIKLGQPLVSTSANISGGDNPKRFSDINKELIENVDYIVNLRHDEIMDTPSSIIKLKEDGSIVKLR